VGEESGLRLGLVGDAEIAAPWLRRFDPRQHASPVADGFTRVCLHSDAATASCIDNLFPGRVELGPTIFSSMGKTRRKKSAAPVTTITSGESGVSQGSNQMITRPRLRRLMLLHERLSAQFRADPQPAKYVNATAIAQELGYERRAIKRDIEWMQDEWHFPIEYNPARHGYYYTREVTQFPTLHITTGQMMALTLACQFIEANRNTPFVQPLREAFQLLEESFCDETVSISFHALCERIRFYPAFEAQFDFEVFDAFREACQNHFQITFTHRKPQPGATADRRRLAPLRLRMMDGGWYAIGYDYERQAIRQFLLSRVTAAQVETQSFEREQYLDLLKEYEKRQGMGPFGNQHPELIRLHFDAEVATIVQERLWHPTQAFTTLENGGLEMTLEMEPNIDLQRWLNGFLGQFEVLEPLSLRQRMAAIGKRMVERHG